MEGNTEALRGEGTNPLGGVVETATDEAQRGCREDSQLQQNMQNRQKGTHEGQLAWSVEEDMMAVEVKG